MRQTRPGSAQRWRLLIVSGVLLTTATAALLLSAEDSTLTLATAEPAAGARVTTAPSTVSLTFTGDLDPEATHIVVVGPDGSPVSIGAPVFDGDTAVQAVRIDAEGPVVVGYHAVNRHNGHGAAGQHQFVVGAGDPSAVAPRVDAVHDHSPPGLPAAIAVTVMVAAGVTVLAIAFLRPGPSPPPR